MKYRVTKATFDKMTDEQKNEYEAADDGKGYTLVIEGQPEPEDSGELKRALERVRADLKTVTTERDEFETKFTDLEGKQTTGDRDVTRLTTRYEKKLADQAAAHTAVVDGYKTQIVKHLKDAVATPLATKISTAPTLLLPKIMERLDVVFPEDGSEAKLVFKGKDGKADDKLTADKISEEFVANPEYKSIIVGSKAKGGGTVPPTGGKPLGSAQSAPEPGSDLSRMGRVDLTNSIREKAMARVTPQA